MANRWVRTGAQTLVTVGVVALLATIPGVAQADTEFDGEATAFQTDGLTLTLFPEDQKFPAPFNQIPPPEEQVINLSSEQLGLPSQFGHAEFPGVDEPGSLPDNPLINGGAFRASSTRSGDRMVSKAVIGHLDIGGAVSLENIVARCTGNGQQISLDAPLARIQGPVHGAVELEPDTATPVTGVGTITWNRQVTDGATYGEASNLVIDLQTNLDADVLQQIPEAMAAFEGVVKQVLLDLKEAGEKNGLPEVPVNPRALSGQPLYDALDDVLAQVPTNQLPDLIPLELSGSITLATAACSQEAVTQPVGNPPVDNEEPPPAEQPPPGTEANEPPLADTGASAWPMRAGLAGLISIAVGGYLVVRQSRRAGQT